jgi:hypothetical protein
MLELEDAAAFQQGTISQADLVPAVPEERGVPLSG